MKIQKDFCLLKQNKIITKSLQSFKRIIDFTSITIHPKTQFAINDFITQKHPPDIP